MQAAEKGVLRLRQYNGDAECDGSLRIINRGVMGTGCEGATTLQVNGRAERNREGSFVGLLCAHNAVTRQS